MHERLGNIYARLFGHEWLAKAHKALFYFSGRALGINNYSSEAISGEIDVIRRLLGAIEQPVVFDVGANEGLWSASVLRVNPRSLLHAFEPQHELASAIASRLPRVKANCAALGEAKGSLELHDYANHEGSQHASLLHGVIDGVHGGAVRTTQVPVWTLDDYCAENGILAIDLLKIDVEGFELQVLRGSSRMLAEGRVKSIQFEFTYINVLSRVFVSDFFRLLGGRYDLFRVLPRGLLKLREPNVWFNEQFGYQNIVALTKGAASA